MPKEGVDFLQTLSVTIFGKIVDTLEHQKREDCKASIENPEKGEKGKAHKGAINKMVDRMLGQEDVEKKPVFLITGPG